jgi:hypothetical protein
MKKPLSDNPGGFANQHCWLDCFISLLKYINIFNQVQIFFAQETFPLSCLAKAKKMWMVF